MNPFNPRLQHRENRGRGIYNCGSRYQRGNLSRQEINTNREYVSQNRNFRFGSEVRNGNDANRTSLFGNRSIINSKNSFSDFENRRQHRSLNVESFNTMLSRMLQDEYSENISLKLLDPAIQTKQFLDNINNQNEDVVKNMIRVTLKASENKLMESNFRYFLTLVISSKFSTERLDTFISSEFRKSLDMETFNLIIAFFKLVFQILPGLAYESFKSRVDNLCLYSDNLMLKNTIIDEEVLSNLKELKVLVENSFPYTSKGERRIRKKVILADNEDPPDDFRQINIFPTIEDLNLPFKEVFLRRNRMNGVYKSVDDYLDVQFRLMREDFIQPLREGLEHLKHNYDTKGFGIRIYYDVSIMNTLPAERLGIIHNLRFDSSRFKRVNWIHSKRFLYGSLLCLSCDNFTTLLFATVANRDVKDLEKGVIDVKFFDCDPAKDALYTIIETTNMFESYRHVLQKLQETNESNFCLQKYLVFADENITLPGYLNRNRGLEYVYCNNKICLHLDENITLSGYLNRNRGLKYVCCKDRFFPGLDELDWPQAVEFELDESQFRAFKTSLTKEIAIIQGPPGTGKTHLGLKICHCLLRNVQKRIKGFGPILVVCFTNHALDQFLEGILQFTKKIIRIGGRSKSEILQNYLLVEYKKKYRLKNTNVRRLEVQNKISEIGDDLLLLQVNIKLSNDSLLSFEKLSRFVKDSHHNYLKKIGIKNWLSGQSEEKYQSALNVQIDNLVEWMMYIDTINMVKRVILESRDDYTKNDEDDFTNDEDIEVNYINNSRKLDVDDKYISDINVKFENLLEKRRQIIHDEDEPSNHDDGFTMVKSKVEKQLFKKRLRSHDKMTQEEAFALDSIDNLDIKTRWKLYNYWKCRYVESLNENSRKLEIEYESHITQLNELNFEDDRQIMMGQDIIGMTTTGAARYGRVLSQIQCKIIIVEEAAEVLESHVIGSLNPGCEHLILIGDHKQLKPNPAVYELARSYNLDLSLFERLINNNLHFSTLELQHRMRPEIADVMKHIYKNLKNHESVLTYPNVPAVNTNIFFFNHTERETLNEEINSYSNKFEAEFIVKFCVHLMKNGIEKTQITVLTLYSGQLFVLKKMMPKDTFEGIRVCVVDNYQGEENDIIVLSLVRSNEMEKIGFLSIENRICVCLSRAKHGLFVFGNFQILTNHNKLWKDICFDLKKKNQLGDKLVLFCQNHPEKRLEIKNPKDFEKYPEGGCEQICNQRLICGHACKKACHFLDKNHQEVQCLENVTKHCPNEHSYELQCWQEYNCTVSMLKKILICNHEQFMPCHVLPQHDNCISKCERKLECGHTCLRPCRERCGRCLRQLRKVSPECGHEGVYYCSDTKLSCRQKCNATLDCGHPCSGTCIQCYMGRLHLSCKVSCQNQLICGHVCKAPCSVDCPPCKERCEEGCVHNIRSKICGDEYALCHEKCEWRCQHMTCTKKCYEICDREMCNKSCAKILGCQKCNKSFKCYGVCGELCRRICLRCDPEVKEIFFGTEKKKYAKFITLWTCDHTFETQSMDKYMNIGNGCEIVQKRCPKCKTVISKRSCFRYMNIVKKISLDIMEVQKIINKGDKNNTIIEFITKYKVNNRKVNELFRTLKVDDYFKISYDVIKVSSNLVKAKYDKCLDMMIDLYDRFYLRFLHKNKKMDDDFPYIETCLARLLIWLNPEGRKFGQFDMTQYECESDRIEYILKLAEARKTHPFTKEIPEFITELKNCKSFSKPFSHEFKEKLNTFVNQKEGDLPNLDIAGIRHDKIVSTISLKDRWFKCQNGHYYAIDGSRGMSQIAKCSECDDLMGQVL